MIRLLLAAAAMPVGAYAQTTITFQQGTASYLSAVDRNLTATTATANVALGEVAMNNGTTVAESQYFLKFDSLFGTGAAFIPTNATILSATLTLKVGATTGDNAAATSSGITVAPMLADFTNATSLVSFTGVSAVGITLLTNGPLYANGLTKLPTAITSPAALSTAYSANVTQAVQAWSSGAYANNGFVVQSQVADLLRVNGDAATTVANRPILSVTYVTNGTTTSFKNGVNGYVGFTGITTQHPALGVVAVTQITTTSTRVVVDGATSNSLPGDAASADLLALMKVGNIFGSAKSQVPTRATISKAWVVVNTGTSSNDQSGGAYNLYRMITAWDTTSTYDSFGPVGGPYLGPVSGTDYVATAVTSSPSSLPQGANSLFDITADITAWKNGTANNGWLIRTRNSSDGWAFNGPGATDVNKRPELQVNYVVEQLRWKGNVSSVWDAGTAVGTGGTNNWTLETAGTATNFIPTDRVLFDDTAAGTGAVTISVAADLQPQRVTFSNVTRDYTLTGPGAVTGGGEFWKTGAGTTTITTNVSLTGGARIFAGTVQVGSGGTVGNLAGPIIVDAGATLTVNRSDNLTNTEAITGAGNAIKLGAGRWDVGAAFNLTGSLTVNGGTLAVGAGARPSSVSVGAGATFAVTSGLTTTTMLVPTLTMAPAGATLQFELATLSNPTVPLLSVTGTDGLVLSGGAHQLNIVSKGSLGLGTFTLVTYAGANISSGFTLNTLPQRLIGNLVYNTAAKSIDLSITDQNQILWNGAVDGTWDAGTGVNLGGTFNWIERANTAGAAPTNYFAGDMVAFDDTAVVRVINLVGEIGPSGLSVNSQYDFTFGGTGTLAPAGTLTKAGTGRLTLLASKTSSGLTAINNGVLQLGDATNTPTLSGTVTIATGANLNVVNGTLAAVTTVATGGSLSVDGGTVSGALNLSGNANFFGGNLSGVATLVSGANLTMKSAFAGTMTGNIVVPTGATLQFEQTAAIRYDKVVSGTGVINMNGTGRTTFSGSSNGFTGTVNINAGEFRIDDPTNTAGDLGVTNIIVNNGGRFQFGDATIGNPDLPNTTYITGNTGGIIAFQEAEDFGGIHLNGGTVLLEQSGFNTQGATVQLWNSGTITTAVGGVTAYAIAGAGFVQKLTTGTVEISGLAALNITGGLQIAEGTLRLVSAANLGNGTMPIALGSDATAVTPTVGTLEYTGLTATRSGAFIVNQGGGVISVTTSGATLTLSGTLSGAGDLKKMGAGNLSMGDSSSYTGLITVKEGGWTLGANSVAQSLSTIRLDGGSLLFAGSVSGASQFNLGELQLSPTAAQRDIALVDTATLPSPATLNLGSKNVDMVYDGTFSGVGSLVKVGTGLLKLTQANPLSGITKLSAGTLTLAHRDALRSSTLDLAGGTLVLDAAVTAKVFALGGLTSSLVTPANLALVNSAGDAVTLEIGRSDASSLFTGVVSGPGGLTKIGNGTLTLSGANTFTGELKVQAGTVALAGVSLLSGGVTIDGGVLQVSTARALENVVTLNVPSSGGIAWGAGVSADISAKLPTLLAGTTFTLDTSGNNVAFALPLAGAATVRKAGAGQLLISAAPGFTGKWVLSGGELAMASDAAFGAVPTNIVADQVILDGGAIQATSSFTLNAKRGLLVRTGSTGYLNPVAGATLRVESVISTESAVATLVIGGPNAFFTGSGTVVLAGANTFAGSWLIQDSTLQVASMGDGTNPSALGLVPMTPAGLKFSGGTLVYNGAGESTARGFTVAGSGARFSSEGNGALVITSAALVDFSNDFSPNRRLTLAGSNLGGNIFAAEMFESDSAQFVFSGLVKEGTGKWLLSGPAARFAPTADFNVNAGQLTFTAGALGDNTYTGPVVVSGTSTLAWAAGNNDDLSARLRITDGSTATFDIASGGLVRLGSSLTFGAAADGRMVKQGSGALVFAAANAFSGGLTVEQGIVRVTAASGLGSSTVTVNGGALSVEANLSNAVQVAGGTLTGSGAVGAVSLGQGAVLSPGVNVGTMTVASLLLFGGSTLKWELADAAGTMGTGYDSLFVTGQLDLISASPATRIVLKAISVGNAGAPLSFQRNLPNSFVFANFGSVALGSNQNLADLFSLDFSEFRYTDGTLVNAADWKVTADASALTLSNIPEPSTYGLGLGALALALVAIRRRKQNKAI
ncbi:MAG: autotransporter-associated beta strand repeat-containing protein [Verrucomicrobiota bacterium]